MTSGNIGQTKQIVLELNLSTSITIKKNRFYLELNIIALARDVDTVGHNGDLAEKCQLVLW